MTISTFRRLYKDNAVSIPVSSIILSERCHKKAFENNESVLKCDDEPLCIVRKNADDTYSLVIGYRDFITAKENGAAEVKAIIVPDKSRKDFLYSLDITFEMWNTSDIFEPKNWTYPSLLKVRNCQKNYEITGAFGKGIVISPIGKILDGYSAVCAARLIGVKQIPVYVFTDNRWQKFNKNKTKKCQKKLLTKVHPYGII